jgi:hypothetical protein
VRVSSILYSEHSVPQQRQFPELVKLDEEDLE